MKKEDLDMIASLIDVVIDEMHRIDTELTDPMESAGLKSLSVVLHGVKGFLYLDVLSMLQLSSLVAKLGSEKIEEIKKRMNDGLTETE